MSICNPWYFVYTAFILHRAKCICREQCIGSRPRKCFRHVSGGSCHGCSKAWAWAVPGVLGAGMGTPRVLRTREQQALMPHLWPRWHCRCTMLKALGSAAGMRSRHRCHEPWASDHIARGMRLAPVLWALGSVILHAHKSLCP